MRASAFTVVVLFAHLSSAASAQPPEAHELPAVLREQLASVEDYRLDFDHPAVYALIAHLRSTPEPPGRYIEPFGPEQLREALERPADFRGRPMTVEGVVGRNSSWKLRNEGAAPRDRPIWQLELSIPDQPVAATVLLTEPADDIPIGARVRVTGYFVMMRSYYDRRNRLQQAALLVAHSPTLVSMRAPVAERGPRAVSIGIAAATLVIVIVWLLVRWKAARSAAGGAEVRPPHPAPFSVADDLSLWANSEEEGSRREDSAS